MEIGAGLYFNIDIVPLYKIRSTVCCLLAGRRGVLVFLFLSTGVYFTV